MSVAVSGPGSIASAPAGIACGTTCSAEFDVGASVTLTATPTGNATFANWSGACSGTASSCTLNIQAATSVSAMFNEPPPPTATNTCASVAQYGITFTFDRPYPCGQFANGDYWVTPLSATGTVTITAMSPAATGSQNGWQVNPSHSKKQGFDSESDFYDAGVVPSLPYAARAGESIVKATSFRSGSGQRTFLDTAAVLTVLGSVPTDNGATVFRPPYFGTDKPLYSTSNLRLDQLPRLAPVANTPTLATVERRYQRVQLDHLSEWSAHYIFPQQNMPHYGSNIAIENANAALRLMLNDSTSAKLRAAINYVQYGIDLAAARRGGTHFEAAGGHRHGRKLVLALTAFLLNDNSIAALVRDAPYNTYQEDGHVYFSTTAGRVLWGAPCSESDYWYNQNNPGHGSADCRDPYGYIDGGDESGLSYQYCCTVKAYVADALILRLAPQLRCIWNNDDILAFADRWVTFGTWAQPDPYAPHGNGAPDNNPANGVGRWPGNHNRFANEGNYNSPFADAMWVAYRNTVPAPVTCPP